MSVRFVFISFLYPILSFQFSLHFYDKINEKRRGLYCVGEDLFRVDFWRWPDCVIIGISFLGFGCVDFLLVVGGGSFACGFFTYFLGFWYGILVVSGLRESWLRRMFIYLGMWWWIIFFFELLFFRCQIVAGQKQKDLRNQ